MQQALSEHCARSRQGLELLRASLQATGKHVITLLLPLEPDPGGIEQQVTMGIKGNSAPQTAGREQSGHTAAAFRCMATATPAAVRCTPAAAITRASMRARRELLPAQLTCRGGALHSC